jgi:crotonobetainyl-CoA:carnitine CoA-transferase CaiB-like acyl-CoA transferase
MPTKSKKSPLAGITVVEKASDFAAAYAGRLLSVLGAEVVMIEPPGGTPLRTEKPYLGDSGISAAFAYLSAGKTSQNIDLLTPEGRACADGLLGRAAILIDDTPVAERSALGLDPERIATRHPHLVHTSVLPFGAVGPKASWSAKEINLIHATGEGYLLPNGLSLEEFPDRPPLKIFGNFTCYNGGVSAALGSLAALWSQPKVGGQFVDISVQETGVMLGLMAIQQFGEGSLEHRSNRSFRYGGVIKCADGFVEILTLEEIQWQGLVELMGRPDWAVKPELANANDRGKLGADINQKLREWASNQSVGYIVARGQELGVPVAKFVTPREVLNGQQERARRLFAPINIPSLGSVEMFTAPFRFGPEPLELHHCTEPAKPLRATVATPRVFGAPLVERPAGALVGPLHGIRIVDFTIHAAGPFATHMLTQLGAECIKVESTKRLDMFRRPHPVYGRLKPSTFAHVVAGKRSVRINLKHPKGIALARKLASSADIVAESFRAGVMERLGLGYNAIREIKPDIILLSLCASGQTGPERSFKGYAPLFAAWGALGTLSGYTDGPPLEVRHFMDHAIGLTGAMATIAALNARRISGEGAHVDVAGREVACSMIGEALLQGALGIETERPGNSHLGMAPHGIYPAKQDDTWVAIAVTDDSEWKRLAVLMQQPRLANDQRFSTVPDRIQHRDELDKLLGQWTSTHSAISLTEMLQQQGIAAHWSMNSADIVADPHLRYRGAIFDVPVAEGDTRPAIRVPMRFSKTSRTGFDDGAPPALGEGEDDIYGRMLGLSDMERRQLEDEQVIY